MWIYNKRSLIFLFESTNFVNSSYFIIKILPKSKFNHTYPEFLVNIGTYTSSNLFYKSPLLNHFSDNLFCSYHNPYNIVSLNLLRRKKQLKCHYYNKNINNFWLLVWKLTHCLIFYMVSDYYTHLNQFISFIFVLFDWFTFHW